MRTVLCFVTLCLGLEELGGITKFAGILTYRPYYRQPPTATSTTTVSYHRHPVTIQQIPAASCKQEGFVTRTHEV